jgi:dienelactone hydrolase
VSFHGGLNRPSPADAKNIRCKVLDLYGGEDPHVPRKDVDAFEDEMLASGAFAGFTPNPCAPPTPRPGELDQRGLITDEKQQGSP